MTLQRPKRLATLESLWSGCDVRGVWIACSAPEIGRKATSVVERFGEKARVMGTSTYDPRSYWNELVTGDGRLSNVGQPALGVYNSYAYRSRLRSLNNALEGVGLGHMKVFEAAFGEGFYLAY